LVSPKVTYNDIKKWQEVLPFFSNGRKICYKMIELNFYKGSSFRAKLRVLFSPKKQTQIKTSMNSSLAVKKTIVRKSEHGPVSPALTEKIFGAFQGKQFVDCSDAYGTDDEATRRYFIQEVYEPMERISPMQRDHIFRILGDRRIHAALKFAFEGVIINRAMSLENMVRELLDLQSMFNDQTH
jgi:hypothetical protein